MRSFLTLFTYAKEKLVEENAILVCVTHRELNRIAEDSGFTGYDLRWHVKESAKSYGLDVDFNVENGDAQIRLARAPSDSRPCDLEIDCDALRDKEVRLLSRAMGCNIESRDLPGGGYRHVVKETPMTWTTEYPTKAGRYWLRNYQFKEDRNISETPIIVCVSDWTGLVTENQLTFAFDGDDQDFNFTRLISGEWYGPIEPPE